MSGILDRIVAHKRSEVTALEKVTSLDALRKRGASMPPCRGLEAALRQRVSQERCAVIAEIKKASPSKGVLRDPFDAAAIARQYQRADATALSVLTDQTFFQGHEDDLKAARAATRLPILRKDFIVNEWQIYQSRALGADCILLIAAVLDYQQLQDYHALGKELGMDVLVEVHTHSEMEKAATFSPPLIGINNRNLDTFEVSLQTSIECQKIAPPGSLIVCESGINNRAAMERLTKHGIYAFLIGEHLMRATHPEQALTTLLSRQA